VLEAVEQLRPYCPSEALPDLLLLKGRTLLNRGGDREDLLRAGLSFMRVVIHFPDHDLAPEALIEAAEVHERLELPVPAIRLLNECLAHQRTSEPQRQRAEAHRARLREALAG
jgi:hypothetical protein